MDSVQDKNSPNGNNPSVLFIEPYYGGSHKTFIDTLIAACPPHSTSLVTLTAKKWHWRARCAPLALFDMIPSVSSESVLLCSSVLNLAELLGIRPDLQPLRKIVYFHENQLVYPVQTIKERDVQYAFNQINTCLAADIVVFNSIFNQTSFLDNLPKIVKFLPDYRPKNLRTTIEPKCQVLYFPVTFPLITPLSNVPRSSSILHIVWPHRWEFDKGPDDFFHVLMKLKRTGDVLFKVSILGETFAYNPPIFEQAKTMLHDEISHFGYVASKEEYYRILSAAHVVVSTAKHEFFGVSMLEAVHCGCYPLVPNRLVYSEIYPDECLYSDLDDLHARLRNFCQTPLLAVEKRNQLDMDFKKYSKDELIPHYLKLFNN